MFLKPPKAPLRDLLGLNQLLKADSDPINRSMGPYLLQEKTNIFKMKTRSSYKRIEENGAFRRVLLEDLPSNFQVLDITMSSIVQELINHERFTRNGKTNKCNC
jgi:hypothetical protein